ncbi:hypothetical protein BECAL_00570 [Bellilinea caldifistulae]|uniref:hypothetical protein n=1 Tax=Bellilinea caldifistulae TaxID=360411 RepID=UPI000783135F|nr:hypothetical protein [Bellilinea caldifistulae]GAP09165.1 hypothetical protein BECAL_00305 [Bellilinea caldifistulae]GAP09426.1 hypothetical protein BECAL_00570 [Bellilinea caldifistulae]
MGVYAFFNQSGTDEQVLDNLSVLYSTQLQLMREAKRRGKLPAFNVAYFFVDVLDCLGRLDYDSLVRVLGEDTAKQVWDEVKPSGCTH